MAFLLGYSSLRFQTDPPPDLRVEETGPTPLYTLRKSLPDAAVGVDEHAPYCATAHLSCHDWSNRCSGGSLYENHPNVAVVCFGDDSSPRCGSDDQCRPRA